MINTEQNVGLSGEFQVIVRRADGSIKFDTGMQPNLILDNGLKQYLELPTLNNLGKPQAVRNLRLLRYCCVGTGNQAPQNGDYALQALTTFHREYRDIVEGFEVPETGKHDGYVKYWTSAKFIFDNIENKNITEVGLASWTGSEIVDGIFQSNLYTLVTRALLKDKQGTPISVTVLKGEVLEIVYQLNFYVDVRRKTGTFNLTTTKDNQDTTATFDYFSQTYGFSNSGGSYIDYPLYLSGNVGVTTWGVKETDTELSASYDINDAEYQKFKFNNASGVLTDKLTQKLTSFYTTSVYSNSYLNLEVTERSFETGRITYKCTNGIYTHNHTNGIRAISFAVAAGSDSSVFRNFIAVKNQANGQGIKKNDRQMWEFTCSINVKRWGG